MPVRIYAFAKELGLDNKQLLDICERANIKGKGSALASLDEDEISSIKAFMDGGGGVATEPEVEENAPVRPAPFRTAPSKKKIGEIVAPQAKPKEPHPVSEDDSADGQAIESPVEEEAPAPEEKPKSKVGGLLSRLRGKSKTGPAEEQPPAPAKPTGPTRRLPDAKPKMPLAPTPPRRNVPRQPLRNLDQPTAKGSGSGEKKDNRRKGQANIRVAAMPQVKQPTAGSEVTGEKVQKPDIALPQDAIKSVKAGDGMAPLQHLTKKKGKGKGDGTKDDEDGRKMSSVRRAGSSRNTNQLSSRNRPRNNRNWRRPGTSRRSGPKTNTAAPRKDSVVLQLPCSVREFSEAAGVSSIQVLLTIKQFGDESNRTINSDLPDEMVDLLVDHFDVQVEIREARSLEDNMLANFDPSNEDPESLTPRAPIVTFLGHVDHGKTSLLDALIGIDVVSGEAGGITQHIRAYEITKGDHKIAFVDTPGHEAFTEMRARGANVTDIAVLVVAADDGIMPQTEEAISHAKAAGVPIIVALNKIDLPGITADKALQDLATHELLPSEWGGDTEVIKTSAIAGTGLDELLETILVTAELNEYKANPSREAFGTCLEAEHQADRGVVAKMMVQGGTLNVGDIVVCGGAFGKVKAMHDTLHPKKKMKSAEPSTPVNLTGLDVAPGAGDKFYVVDDVATARSIAETRQHRGKVAQVGGRSVETSLEDFMMMMESGNLSRNSDDMVTLNLIIRADVKGSIEAIQKELGKISHPEVEIKILQALAGGVTVGDVRLADASKAVIVCFNVVANEDARSLADDLGVEIRRYDVIYKITDDLKATLEGRLKPEESIVEVGMAMVLKTFSVSKTGMIAGCRVMRGSIQRECRMRVIRDQTVIGDYPIESLKREKDDAKEVQRGMECGIKLEKFNDIKEGDTLEAYKIEEIARTL